MAAQTSSSTYPALFSPWRLRGKEIPNRIAFAPLSVGYASADGFVTDKMVGHYARRARGGAGLIMTEHVAIDITGRQLPRQPLVTGSEHLPGLRRLAAAVRPHGSRLIAQVGHAGRYAGPWEEYEARRRLAPSAIPFRLTADRIVKPQEITLEEIEAAIQAFGTAAKLIAEAGFDGLQIHASQGFLPSEFLSKRMNRRSDDYGGSFDGRVRFLKESVRAARDHVPDDFILGVQLLADEIADGGWPLHEAVRLAIDLEDLGVDFILPTVTTFDTGRMLNEQNRDIRWGYQLGAALAIKAACKIPVIANGGLREPVKMEHFVGDDHVDAVGLGRPLLTDPEWPQKVACGREHEVVTCACSPPVCLQTQLTGVMCTAWQPEEKEAGFLGILPTPETSRPQEQEEVGLRCTRLRTDKETHDG